VLETTLELARRIGLETAMTEPTFDLDVADDLQGFSRYTDQQLSDLCPRTVESIAVLRSSGVL
jgi:hypothetical protein